MQQSSLTCDHCKLGNIKAINIILCFLKWIICWRVLILDQVFPRSLLLFAFLNPHAIPSYKIKNRTRKLNCCYLFNEFGGCDLKINGQSLIWICLDHMIQVHMVLVWSTWYNYGSYSLFVSRLRTWQESHFSLHLINAMPWSADP